MSKQSKPQTAGQAIIYDANGHEEHDNKHQQLFEHAVDLLLAAGILKLVNVNIIFEENEDPQ